jgi:hypothetical protein
MKQSREATAYFEDDVADGTSFVSPLCNEVPTRPQMIFPARTPLLN